MAKKIEDVALPDDVTPETEPKVRVAPEIQKQARLLFEIAGLYRSAGQALKAGDERAYKRASGLITQYQGLFNALAQEVSDDITAEGLAAISEM